MLGINKPVASSFLNSNLLGVCFGDLAAGLFVSGLNSLFGEVFLMAMFLLRGVLFGVLGRSACGVICLEGVVGFLTGVFR